jgi:hypothetical protein
MNTVNPKHTVRSFATVKKSIAILAGVGKKGCELSDTRWTASFRDFVATLTRQIFCTVSHEGGKRINQQSGSEGQTVARGRADYTVHS